MVRRRQLDGGTAGALDGLAPAAVGGGPPWLWQDGEHEAGVGSGCEGEAAAEA